jgi:hypothetical protein
LGKKTKIGHSLIFHPTFWGPQSTPCCAAMSQTPSKLNPAAFAFVPRGSTAHSAPSSPPPGPPGPAAKYEPEPRGGGGSGGLVGGDGARATEGPKLCDMCGQLPVHRTAVVPDSGAHRQLCVRCAFNMAGMGVAPGAVVPQGDYGPTPVVPPLLMQVPPQPQQMQAQMPPFTLQPFQMQQPLQQDQPQQWALPFSVMLVPPPFAGALSPTPWNELSSICPVCPACSGIFPCQRMRKMAIRCTCGHVFCSGCLADPVACVCGNDLPPGMAVMTPPPQMLGSGSPYELTNAVCLRLCFKCQMPGHLYKNCPTINCFACNRSGHMVADCSYTAQRKRVSASKQAAAAVAAAAAAAAATAAGAATDTFSSTGLAPIVELPQAEAQTTANIDYQGPEELETAGETIN